MPDLGTLRRHAVLPAALAVMLAGCGSSPVDPEALEPPVEFGMAGPAAAPPPSERAAEVVILAMDYIDTPYRRGGTDREQGFDCSGFTRHVFERSLGIALPRRSEEQARASSLVRVRRSELAAGDLVFFNTLARQYSHVGIYVGDDRFIHAPRTGAAVRIEDMSLPYWKARYNGARRASPSAIAN